MNFLTFYWQFFHKFFSTIVMKIRFLLEILAASMKFLCCQQYLDNLNSLKKHFISQHNVNPNNYFFKRLFTKDRVFSQRKCFRCDHFCYNGREEKIHHFLSHYQQGGKLPIKDKPLKKIILSKTCRNVASPLTDIQVTIIFLIPKKLCRSF